LRDRSTVRNASASSRPVRQRRLVLTVAVTALTAAVAGAGLLDPHVQLALRRDPDALAAGRGQIVRAERLPRAVDAPILYPRVGSIQRRPEAIAKPGVSNFER